MTSKELYHFLEENYERYNRPDFITSDPVSIPHRFSKKQDIEIAGFLAATIAWGQRSTIIKNSDELMKRMDNSPHDFILNHSKRDFTYFKNFKHRTFNGTDCIFFLKSLQNIYKKHSSLEQIFTGAGAQERITNFRNVFFSISYPERSRKHVSRPPLLPSGPGSSCKRINMFLRWMVRTDKRGVDFGIWKHIQMNELMCPLDVHSGNVSRKLGLLDRKQNDWKSVEELTSRLKEFDPKDPVKYDFALFGLGIHEKF